MKSTRISLVVLLAVTVPAWAAGFKVVSTTIDPAPNQRIPVEATGTDAVQGMNLTVQVKQGSLAITDMEIAGTIWDLNNSGPSVWVYPAEGFPSAQFGVMMVTTASGAVATPGIAAIIIVDATGLAGQSATVTANYSEIRSDWAGGPIDGYEDGIITIRTIEPPAENQPPVVNAGPDQTVTAGASVQLSGNATDPESGAMTYLWWQIAGPSVTLSSTIIPNPTFVAPSVSTATQLEFQFRVSDASLTRTDTVVVTVNPQPASDPPSDPPSDPADPPSDPADPVTPPGDDPGDPQTPPTSGDPSTVTPTTPGGTTGGDSTGSNTDPTGGSDPADHNDQSDTTETSHSAGAPACAMGIADGALFACAGFWLMLLRPLRRSDD